MFESLLYQSLGSQVTINQTTKLQTFLIFTKLIGIPYFPFRMSHQKISSLLYHLTAKRKHPFSFFKLRKVHLQRCMHLFAPVAESSSCSNTSEYFLPQSAAPNLGAQTFRTTRKKLKGKRGNRRSTKREKDLAPTSVK